MTFSKLLKSFRCVCVMSPHSPSLSHQKWTVDDSDQNVHLQSHHQLRISFCYLIFCFFISLAFFLWACLIYKDVVAGLTGRADQLSKSLHHSSSRCNSPSSVLHLKIKLPKAFFPQFRHLLSCVWSILLQLWSSWWWK